MLAWIRGELSFLAADISDENPLFRYAWRLGPAFCQTQSEPWLQRGRGGVYITRTSNRPALPLRTKDHLNSAVCEWPLRVEAV
jgi:hypothetical protein